MVKDETEDAQSKMSKFNFTTEETNAQIRFKAAWDAWRKEEKGRTQQWMAEQLDINQSSFSAYIVGRNPLNINFLLKACTIMGCNPRDIYPELFENIAIPQTTDSTERAEVIEIVRNLPDDKVSALKLLLKSMM